MGISSFEFQQGLRSSREKGLAKVSFAVEDLLRSEECFTQGCEFVHGEE
jgi:hypothetical protein